MIDINGKPYMHSKGIITQNVESTWKILCDDNGDFHLNGSQIANDVCNVIGFKSVFTKSQFSRIEFITIGLFF